MKFIKFNALAGLYILIVNVCPGLFLISTLMALKSACFTLIEVEGKII
jgi:type III secretory pathway component EscV